MTQALAALDHHALRTFFDEIGVATDAPDGFRVFPAGHNAQTIIDALENEMKRIGAKLLCNQRVTSLIHDEEKVTGVRTADHIFNASNVIIATGGLGYPGLGAQGDGFALAKAAGHTVTGLYPAMTPLKTKENWVAQCRADTIPKARLRIALPKHKQKAVGDLIFTKDGIRGPVVLDFAREITPLLEKGEVPLLVNMTGGLDEDALFRHLKAQSAKSPEADTLTLLATLLPESVAQALCHQSGADSKTHFARLPGTIREKLVRLLAWTPLTVTGHEGFAKAMITRGGIPLKEIRPESMESKTLQGLYFCGEVMDLDGPCGGYNLQWSFSSGHLAGLSIIGET